MPAPLAGRLKPPRDPRTAPPQAKEDLLKVLSAFKGATVVKDDGSYIYCEFEREFGFVDDVEFLFAPDGQASIRPTPLPQPRPSQWRSIAASPRGEQRQPAAPVRPRL